MTQFNVDDKVTHTTCDETGHVRFGPFDSNAGRNVYLVELEDGKHRMVRAQFLAPFAEVFKAGDRVTGTHSGHKYVVQAGPFTDDRGAFYVVRSDGRDGPIHAENLRAEATPANTYTVNGVTYDASETYRDHDGDVWSFTGKMIVGEPTLTYGGNPHSETTLGNVVAWNGPLVRVRR